MKKEFYLCKHCGNLVKLINKGGGTLVCCGESMERLEVNTVDADHEKHIPVIKKINDGDRSILEIEIGAVPHPMIPEHYIDFIYVEYDDGGTLVKLEKEATPIVSLDVTKNTVIGVYAYCNLHGLWGKDLRQ